MSEVSQLRWPRPGSWLSGPTRQFLSSAAAPRAAPPRMNVPAPASTAAVMRSSWSRWTAEYGIWKTSKTPMAM